MKILNDLKKREIFNNITNQNKFAKIPLGSSLYIGFDPTAPSLHLGNYVQIVQLLRFKKAGYQPIALLGGATGMIGDPSGKNVERNLLAENILQINKKGLKKQLKHFGLKVRDNYDFYKNYHFLVFLREVGKLINVNYMINKEVIASRLEAGISFTEFTYQLIQGWDFKCLYEKDNVRLQLGGSDQWGNITTGIEIIRKVFGEDNLAVGITTNLLTTANGQKFGKSENNALWLDKNLTTPFQLYQYLLNTSDQDVAKLLKWLTFLPLKTIAQVIKKHASNPHLRYAQKTLAQEVVQDIHSQQDAEQAIAISKALFGEGQISKFKSQDFLQLKGAIPTITTTSQPLIELLVAVKAAVSKREAREFINNNSISVNGIKVNDPLFIIKDKVSLIKRGAKKYFLILIK